MCHPLQELCILEYSVYESMQFATDKATTRSGDSSVKSSLEICIFSRALCTLWLVHTQVFAGACYSFAADVGVLEQSALLYLKNEMNNGNNKKYMFFFIIVVTFDGLGHDEQSSLLFGGRYECVFGRLYL